jgi:hypothetical protein
MKICDENYRCSKACPRVVSMGEFGKIQFSLRYNKEVIADLYRTFPERPGYWKLHGKYTVPLTNDNLRIAVQFALKHQFEMRPQFKAMAERLAALDKDSSTTQGSSLNF